MEQWLLELGFHQWSGVLLILMKILGVVLEVMQRGQGVLQALVLEQLLLLMQVVLAEVVVLIVTVVVPVQPLLGHIMHKRLVLEELLKLLEGFFVGHKPVLRRSGTQTNAEVSRTMNGGEGVVPLRGQS